MLFRRYIQPSQGSLDVDDLLMVLAANATYYDTNNKDWFLLDKLELRGKDWENITRPNQPLNALVDVWFSKKASTLMVSFRGSESWRDWFYGNFKVGKKEICEQFPQQGLSNSYDCGHFVHEGFLENYSSLRDSIHSVITDVLSDKYRTSDPITILVTGHSKGGGMAQIAAFDILQHPGVTNRVIKKIRCTTFGQPSIANTTLVESFTNNMKEINATYTSVVTHRRGHLYDLVPHLPDMVSSLLWLWPSWMLWPQSHQILHSYPYNNIDPIYVGRTQNVTEYGFDHGMNAYAEAVEQLVDPDGRWLTSCISIVEKDLEANANPSLRNFYSRKEVRQGVATSICYRRRNLKPPPLGFIRF